MHVLLMLLLKSLLLEGLIFQTESHIMNTYQITFNINHSIKNRNSVSNIK